MQNPVKIVSEIIAPSIGLGEYLQPEPVAAVVAVYLRSEDGAADKRALLRGIWNYHNTASDAERTEANAAIIDATIAIRSHVRELIIAEAAARMVAA